MFKLTDPFRPIGIPKTATYLGEAYLGSSESDHAGLKVQHWENRSGKGAVWGLFLAADTTSYFAEIASIASTVV